MLHGELIFVRLMPWDCWVDILLENITKRFSGITDEELAVLARTDKAACEALILRCLKLIFIKSVSYSSDVSDRDDLCQEGAIALLKAIAAYDISRGAKFMTYAEVCIVNQMRSFCTRTMRTPANCESIDEFPEDTLSEEKTPESIIINKEFFSELSSAVETDLSANERRVFTQVIQGASYRETAEKLGISEKSVDNAMQRARRKIRQRLSG